MPCKAGELPTQGFKLGATENQNLDATDSTNESTIVMNFGEIDQSTPPLWHSIAQTHCVRGVQKLVSETGGDYQLSNKPLFKLGA